MADEEEGIIDDVHNDVAAALSELRGETPEGRDTQGGGDQSSATADTASEDDSRPQTREDGRDERGRFAAKSDKAADKQSEVQAQPKAVASQGQPAPTQPDKAGQVPGWLSPAGKSKWYAVPNDVKADIAALEQRAAQGVEAQRMYSDLEPFARRAAHFGQRLSDAMQAYVGIEDLISRDIGAGLTLICRNKGLNQQQAASLFSDLARKYGADPGSRVWQNGHNPSAAAQTDDPLSELLTPLLAPLQQRLDGMQSQFSNFYTAQQQAEQARHEAGINSLTGEIAKFADDPAHLYFEDVAETMNFLFESGRVARTGNHQADLQKAYDMAVRMDDRTFSAWQGQQQEAREAERKAKEQEAANKARKASRSLSGNQIPGTVIKPATNSIAAQDDVMNDVIAAYKTTTMA